MRTGVDYVMAAVNADVWREIRIARSASGARIRWRSHTPGSGVRSRSAPRRPCQRAGVAAEMLSIGGAPSAAGWDRA